MIRTVLKDVCPEDIRHIQCHEHIWLSKGASYNQNHALCMDDEARSLEELSLYREAGGMLIVDAQPSFCGRNVEILAELSRKSSVHIVAVSGFHKKIFFDNKDIFEWDESALRELFLEEIKYGIRTESMESTSYKAGMLKVAVENNWQEDPIYRRMFWAVASVAKETRAPIMVHTEKGNDILSLIDWFKRNGVEAEQLLICHLDRTCYDAEYHREVLATGCSLCYDSVHRLKYVSEEEELALLYQMKRWNFLDSIVLSLDTTNQRLRSYYAEDMGLDYILKEYIPQLLNNGFTERDIDKMCVLNARRILNF